MQIIALLSQKGGAGKSTLAIHLAAEAAARGFRTLLMDLDPQAAAARWGDQRGDKAPDVAPEHPARLDAALAAAQAEGYQIVVLDTAPHTDQAALRAAKSANVILIPCRPATFDLYAVQSSLEVAELAKRPATVVLNAAPIRSKVVEEAAAEIARLGGTVCPVVIRHRVAYQHCLIDGQVAREFEPEGAAAAEIEALCKSECLHDIMLAGKQERKNGKQAIAGGAQAATVAAGRTRGRRTAAG